MGYDIVRKANAETNISLYGNYPVESLQKRRFYNIGAGLFHHPYWTNVDYATDHYKGVQKYDFIHYNLMELKPLPIESNVAEIVYSSHTIEHVSDDAVLNMLKESYRILKPGGCIRLTTPNMALEYKAYQRNDLKFWSWVGSYIQTGTYEHLYKIPLNKASIHQLFLEHFATQLSEITIDDLPEKKYSDEEICQIFQNIR